jgi:hypothetical protein
MIVPKQLIEGANANLLVDQDRDPIANREESIEIMGHHEDGQAEARLQISD